MTDHQGRRARTIVALLSAAGLLAGMGCAATIDTVPAVGAPAPPHRQAVTPPTPGDIHHTVQPRRQVRNKPVRIDEAGDAGGGVTVRLTRVLPITATAQLPGEVAGPALALSLTVHNRSAQPLVLTSLVVTLTDSAGDPMTEMSTPPARAVTGELARGRSASGTYVFTVATNRRAPVTAEVSLAGELPVLVFQGDVQ